MKAIRLYGQRGPDQIVFEDVPQPQLGVGEVLIRVNATSVMWQEPTWPETWKTPAGIERQHPIPGHDVSGEIVGVGPGVTGVAVGEAVYALTEFWRGGAAAGYPVARPTDLRPNPPTLWPTHPAEVPLAAFEPHPT